MTPLWWSIALAAIGILGIWLAGRKSHWGWAVGVLAQFLWITYAIVTMQWGFIASAVAYGVIYSWNWWRWKYPKSKKDQGHPGWPTFTVGNIDWIMVKQTRDYQSGDCTMTAVPIEQFKREQRIRYGTDDDATGVHGGRGQEAQGVQPDPRTDPRRHAKDSRGRHVRRKGDRGTGQVVDATSAAHTPRRGAVRAARSRVNAALRAYGAAWLALLRSVIFW